MKNANDPYNGILNLMNKMTCNGLQATAAIGEILSVPPNIAIGYNGMTITSQYLWID